MGLTKPSVTRIRAVPDGLHHLHPVLDPGGLLAQLGRCVMAANLSKANIAAKLRGMAREAADPMYAAGLSAAADLLDDGAGAGLHTCKHPDKGISYQCRACGIKWFRFYRETPGGLLGVWEPDSRRRVAS